MINKLKIIRTPEDVHNYEAIPSLAMASIASYLRSNGHNIEQMDLRYSLPRSSLYRLYDHILDDTSRIKKFMLTIIRTNMNLLSNEQAEKLVLAKPDCFLWCRKVNIPRYS